MRDIEIDERRWHALHEYAIAGTRVTVAHDLVSISERTIQRRVMELTQQARSGGQLIVGEGPELRRHRPGNIREDFSSGAVDSKESRSASKSASIEMLQQVMDQRRVRGDGTTDGVSDPRDAVRRSFATERDLLLHLLCDSLHPIAEQRREPRFDLLLVRRRVRPGKDNALRQLRFPARDCVKEPVESHRRSVERHLDRERSSRPNITNRPHPRWLPWHQRSALRPVGEWAIQVECGRGIAPGGDVRPKAPRKFRTDIDLNRLLEHQRVVGHGFDRTSIGALAVSIVSAHPTGEQSLGSTIWTSTSRVTGPNTMPGTFVVSFHS